MITLGVLIGNILVGTVLLVIGCLILDKIQQWTKKGNSNESTNQNKTQ
jgi:hypothetical protein